MENEFLVDIKKNNIERLVSHLNSVGAVIVAQYPMAEVQSWTLQKNEAETIIKAGNSSMPSMAPFLTKVCLAQFGPSAELDVIRQVREKAIQVKNNSDTWTALSAYVNGLRARVQNNIEMSTTESEAHIFLRDAFTELEAFRRLHNI